MVLMHQQNGERMSQAFSRSAEFFRTTPSDKQGDRLEDMIAALYGSVLQPGDLAVDGGAHVGLHSIGMARCVRPDGRIIAVEALARLAGGMLAQQITKHGFGDTIIVENLALGAAPGEAVFHDVFEAPGYSGLRVRTDLPGTLSETVREVRVRVETLDALVARHGQGRPVRFIKLDLEGGEFDCLRGARAALERDRPIVVFEHGQAEAAKLYGYDKGNFFDYFDSVGYRLATLLEEPLTREVWGTGHAVWYVVARPAG